VPNTLLDSRREIKVLSSYFFFLKAFLLAYISWTREFIDDITEYAYIVHWLGSLPSSLPPQPFPPDTHLNGQVLIIHQKGGNFWTQKMNTSAKCGGALGRLRQEEHEFKNSRSVWTTQQDPVSKK
jgi:hypothetical protein